MACMLIPAAGSVENNRAVTDPSKIIVLISREYSTIYASLICSQSQSFLMTIRNAKIAITNRTPPNSRGWKGSMVPRNGSIISSMNIARTPYNTQTIPYMMREIFVKVFTSVILSNQLLLTKFLILWQYV